MEDTKIYVVTFEDMIDDEVDAGVYGDVVFEDIDDAVETVVNSILVEYSGCDIAKTPEEALKSRILRDRNISFNNGTGIMYSYYIHTMILKTKGGN